MAPGIAEKKNNSLPLWGNTSTMNLNHLIITNILSSHYFKNNLYQLKTYHEVIDEIYYQVNHLEPWEKGSRKTSGQTGMCGGVRGVGAGGIVSTAFCILYKLFTLKLTRKQVVGLINHSDSPYIRALGFMYIRYTQPPGDLYEWYENYLDDEEELDVKAGGGQMMSIGEMLRHFLSKLEWFSTLFPRIPVPIQKDLERKMASWRSAHIKSKPSVDSFAEWGETTDETKFANGERTETSGRSLQVTEIQARDSVDSRNRMKEAAVDEVHRDKDKPSNRKEANRASSSSHQGKNYGSHRERSRSPRRSDSEYSKEDELKKSKKRYHEKEKDRNSEKSHKVRKHHDSPERRYSKDRAHSHDRRQERRHDHSHRHHHHSKHHERKEHLHSHDHH